MLRLSSQIVILLLAFNTLAQSPHGDRLNIKCEVCHDPESWAMKLENCTFDHNQTSYPLIGNHKTVDCKLCHVDLIFSNAKSTCLSCHKDMHQQTVGLECDRCHTPRSWIVQNITEIHQLSRFPLQGRHAQIDCYLCHKSASLLLFEPMSSTCVDCHRKDYLATTQPSHVSGKYPDDCFLCHNELSWAPAKFNHNTNTAFPLKGGHIGIECVSCHSNGYKVTSTNCVSCHLASFNSSTNPSHIAAKFSTDCKTCHTETGWKPSSYNHNTTTTFPLNGAHSGVECINCHSKGYAGISTECVSCHLTNFNAATNPNHVTAKYSTDCKICHNVTAWSPSTFNHTTNTTFPLTGAHIGVACANCHSAGYAGISTACSSCHMTNFNATTNPNHLQLKYSTECKICHTVNAWSPSTFNHTTSTSFPLTGAHTTVACATCHTNGYTGISSTCVSCHLANYNATTNPGHVAAKFSTDCATCHTSTAWSPATFNHNTGTAFPLTGSHVGLTCISCHAAGYVGISTACSSCHMNKYTASTNPSHVAAKFPTTCEACHTPTGWTPSTFNHNTSTTFPLAGAHIGVACISCHTAGYVGISTTCVSCHLTNYNATTNPGHTAAKISTDCKICHTVTAWSPATFDHTTGTTFPLTGAHIGLTCISCHTAGYVGIATTCVSCHIASYNSTTNPAHAAAKFPTNCESCHTTTLWTTSTFNHDSQYFKIYSGRHNGQWTLCSECHTSATNYSVFNCLLCHTHNQASMDSAHKGKTGYVYNSANCFSCHPKV